MATYYAGVDGNDGNDGLSWANRRTLPTTLAALTAGDTAIIGPGTYYIDLTNTTQFTANGTEANPITVEGDPWGYRTTGLSGRVRLINHQSVSWSFTGAWWRFLNLNLGNKSSFSGANTVIEDCTLHITQLYYRDDRASSFTMQRCLFMAALSLSNADLSYTYSHSLLVDNCVFMNCVFRTDVKSKFMTVRNCTFLGNGNTWQAAFIIVNYDTDALAMTVRNCMFYNGYTAIWSLYTAAVDVDYSFMVEVGGGYDGPLDGPNDVWLILGDENYGRPTYLFETLFMNFPSLLGPQLQSFLEFDPLLHSDFLGADDGTVPATDVFGNVRPATQSKRLTGAIHYNRAHRQTAVKRSGTWAVKLPDEGDFYQVYVPTSPGVPQTVGCYVYRENNYSGAQPILEVIQPGQSTLSTTIGGGANKWNYGSLNFTPATAHTVVRVRSRNTATSGTYAVYVDDLVVT